ncbi:MAG: polysaccharide biosynthesis tyrosine autokinase [Planctomycetota bacterium]|nr:polysaccharide biosynthesis tyrosine autokinase [Planctomycetota bacterium]
MTSISNPGSSGTPIPPAFSGPRPAMPAMPAAAPGGGGGVAIDPVKLIQRHLWLLVGAVVVGGVLGLVAHFALAMFAPVWKPVVIFRCITPLTEAGQINTPASDTNQQEMDRFMQTQVRQMMGDTVLLRAVEDPRMLQEAPNWIRNFMEQDPNTGQEAVNVPEAKLSLQDRVRARVLSQTSLIELSVSFKDKKDATGMLKLVKEAYMTELTQQAGQSVSDQKRLLEQQVSTRDQQIKNLQRSRDAMIETDKVDSLEQRESDTGQRLQLVSSEIIKLTQEMEALKVQIKDMEDQLQSAGGIRYGDDLRAEVERDPLMLELNTTVARLEGQLQSLRNRGITTEHREFKSITNQIDGVKQNLEETRERLLRKAFDAKLETYKQNNAQRQAQTADLDKQRIDLTKRQQDLTRIRGNIETLDKQIADAVQAKSKSAELLERLNVLSQVQESLRVVIAQSERIPDEVSFPKLLIMLPAGVLGLLGIVSGTIVLREVIDQRIKSPSDVNLLPRTRLLGWIPDAIEDPSGQGAPETAFRDRPRGVVAENFRLLRSGVLKRMQTPGHRTLVVVGGMPGSGSTTVISNLALACAAADQKVLIIDANFRRPAVHRVFALSDGPGLADVLSGSATLEGALQRTADGRVAVLSAGSREKRAFEQLSTDAFSNVLREAKGKFDLVLIDVAPAMVAGDGVAVANRADASLLLIKTFSEKRGMVARIKNELSEARGEFLGVVVNGVKASAGGYLKKNIQATHEYQNNEAA